MHGNDIPTFRPRPYDLILALALLTRIPLPNNVFRAEDAQPAAYAAWAYPLVGLIIGGVAVLAGAIALRIGLPAPLAALLVLLVGVLTTGAMHEDGLADCADGFWGGWTVERRLDIMKDSQIGTYGVLALIFAFGLRWGALATLLTQPGWAWTVLACACISRTAMVCLMHLLPNARQTGLSHQTGRPPRATILIAVGISVLFTLAALPELLLPLMLSATIALGGWGMIAHRKIKGQTGDVLGGAQQCVEIAVLLCTVVLLA